LGRCTSALSCKFVETIENPTMPADRHHSSPRFLKHQAVKLLRPPIQQRHLAALELLSIPESE
jgi:hypothetical protein